MKKNKIYIITSTHWNLSGYHFPCIIVLINLLYLIYRALLWKDSKEKLTLNFMYEPPPGLVKEKTKDDLEEKEETKFEWQRKFNAPREE